MDASTAERATRITPQEWRVIALAIEGMPPSQACEALGIAVGTLESHKQAIRRKLGIPKGQRFEAFVRANFAGNVEFPEAQRRDEKPEPAPPSTEHSDDPRDRRVRWLLRITLDELQELSMSAGLRAQLLAQTVKRMGSASVEEAEREVADLEQLAKDLQSLFETTIANIRARARKQNAS